MNEPRTLIDKLWLSHEIVRRDDGDRLLLVDRHYVHEGSFHASAKLKERRRNRSPSRASPSASPITTCRPAAVRKHRQSRDLRAMVSKLEANAAESHNVRLFGSHDPRQGIVHVVGPEQGLTLPGLLIVCGDSHTSTHGALRRLCLRHRRV
jgi:3-isopropylmalate/(R)-2-methylmalate dehydratase large subunit